MAAAECVRRLRDRSDLEFGILHRRRRTLHRDEEESHEGEEEEEEEFQDLYPCLWSLQQWIFSSVEGIRQEHTSTLAYRDLGGKSLLHFPLERSMTLKTT